MKISNMSADANKQSFKENMIAEIKRIQEEYPELSKNEEDE